MILQILLQVKPETSSLGVILAVVFASAMSYLLWWMFHVPPIVSSAVAKARLSIGALKIILVPTVGTAYSERGVELACRLGEAQKADILLTYVIEVPRTLPLGAPMPESEKIANESIERAKQIVLNHGLKPTGFIERAREAAEGIIRAAKDYQVDTIVMGIRPQLGAAQSILGRTTDALLERAPVELIIDKTISQ